MFVCVGKFWKGIWNINKSGFLCVLGVWGLGQGRGEGLNGWFFDKGWFLNFGNVLLCKNGYEILD